jgi:DNA-directed RNA polymerase specialized sigma24 family protein
VAFFRERQLQDKLEELRKLIQKLSEQQLEAIKDATFLGMSPEVANECEVRRRTISALVDKLAEMCKQ